MWASEILCFLAVQSGTTQVDAHGSRRAVSNRSTPPSPRL